MATAGFADNVIDFNQLLARRSHAAALAEREADGHDDQRQYPRLDSQDRLFAQVVLSADDPELVGTTLSCTAVNVSVGGMQVRCSAPVPNGCLMDLWVDVRSRPGKFFLTGEVVWCRPTGSGDAWLVGLQLKCGAATDIQEWEEFQRQAAVG